MLLSSKTKCLSPTGMKSSSEGTSSRFFNRCPIGIPIAHFEDDYDVSEDPSHRAVEAVPYKKSAIQELIFWVLSLASLGVFPLVLHWIPLAIHRWRFVKTSNVFQASRVVVVDSTRKKQVVRCHRISVRVLALQRALPSFACQRHDTQVSTNETDDENYTTKMNVYRQRQFHLSGKKETFLPSGSVFTAGPNDVLETVTFEYRCLKYILNLWSGKFEPLSFDLGVTSDRLYDVYGMGLPVEGNPEDVPLEDLLIERQQLYGPACVNVPILPLYRVVACEIFHPLYIFQVAAIALWLKDEYYQYAAAIIVITLVMLIVEIFEVRHSQLRLHRMAKFVCDVQVLRRFAEFSFRSSNSSPMETGTSPLCSTFLVPGHVIHVLPNTTMPCDAILLHGTALLNESMLTGESVPVTKTSMPVVPRAGPRKYFDSRFDARHILFGGTEVIAARGAPQSGVPSTSSSPSPTPALALVFRTGFSTTHGRMMRAVLHPSTGTRADFKVETYKFLGFLTILAFIGCGLSLYFTLSKGLQFEVVLIRALDTFPNTIPPALSAAMTVGCSIAVTKLRKFWRIFCIAPSRVNIAGQVNTIVFDKTGTLTADGLELQGVAFVHQREPTVKNGDEEATVENVPVHLKLGHLAACVEEVPLDICGALATCHSVMKVGDRFSGDPIEIQMIQFTKWTLSDVPFDLTELTPTVVSSFIKDLDCYLPCLAEVGAPSDRRDTMVQQGPLQRAAVLRIVKRFEFSPQLQRMSVLVWDRNRGQLSVICKGSPEQLAKLCHPDSVPATATSRLHRYMERGLRVLAFGYKHLDLSQGDWKLAAKSSRSCMAKLESLTRTHVEMELTFLGLAAFSNPLKADTQSAIATLRRAGCRCIMATGDNPLTSISVARTTGIIDRAATELVLLVDVVSPGALTTPTSPEATQSRPFTSLPDDNKNNPLGQLIWTPIVHKPQDIGFSADATEYPLSPSSSSSCAHHDDEDEASSGKPFSTPSLQHLTSASIRSFLDTKDPRSLSFVLTGAAFRHLQSTHHQLYGQGQWSKSAMQAAQPRSVYCLMKPVNAGPTLPIPVDTFRIAIASYPSARSRVYRSDSLCSTTPLCTKNVDPEDPFLYNDGEIDKLGASSNDVTYKQTSRAQTQNTSAWTTSTRDPSGPSFATTGSFRNVKRLWSSLRSPVGSRAAAGRWLNRSGTFSYFTHDSRLSDNSNQIVELSAFEYCLRFTRVYARMSPEDKAALVNELRSLPASPLVAMCGDGANDCAALRAADVGLSLSDKEASMAAPFTSANSTVQSCVNLLRESRSALVNSFQGFKSITLSATIQLMTTVALYYYGSNLTDPQYVWIDLAVVLPLSMTMSWTHAASHLTQELPLRQLTGLPVILSLVGQALIQLFYVIMSLSLLSYVPFYTRFQPDVETTRFGPDDLESYENTVTFLISNGQYLMTNLVLSILGKPWRQCKPYSIPLAPTLMFYSFFPILTSLPRILYHIFLCFLYFTVAAVLSNWTYTTIVSTLLLANFIFILCPNALPSISRWLSIVSMPLYFRWMLVGLFFANSATTYAFEKCVIVNGFARRAQITDLPAHQIDRVLPPLCNNLHHQARITTVVQFVTTSA